MSLWIVVVVGVASTVAGAIFVLRERYIVITVRGFSMTPNIRPGDRLLLRRCRGDELQVGTVVVVRRQVQKVFTGQTAEWAVKRVAALPGDAVPESVLGAVRGLSVVPCGMLVLLADNPAGSDSRRWGFAADDQVLGAAVAKLAPLHRTSWRQRTPPAVGTSLGAKQ